MLSHPLGEAIVAWHPAPASISSFLEWALVLPLSIAAQFIGHANPC
jgi:hypothetical protein